MDLDYLKGAVNFPVRLHNPPNPTLAFKSMVAREELGRPFEYEVELVSVQDDITLDSVIGKTMTVELETNDGTVRHWNGHIARFAHSGSMGKFALYRATLRPWLWLLTRTSDCRVFYKGDAGQTVPEVIQEVFRHYELTDFRVALSREYRKWDYLVQYRESAFNFVSRLMEQEGIFYYFEHAAGKHTLVLTDAIRDDEVPAYGNIPYYPPTEGGRRERDHIESWFVTQQLDSGGFALADYDFSNPSSPMRAKLERPPAHAMNRFEQFEYPGEFETAADGQVYTRLRLEEQQTFHMAYSGQGNARGLAVGSVFQLRNHPRHNQNKKYLLAGATHQLEGPNYESLGGNPERELYRCSFTAIESKHDFRPARITPRPVVQGPQTAIVVGPSGEEIWTDKHGRVKVQFHWDRYGKLDDKSSCWVRVSQIWAGSGWGAMHIPRIGQEVVVEFLEGDPDRPLITGRVYNGLSTPPWELTKDKTKSGIKSRSSKGGSAANANEIRFEDLKGSEQIFIHAEKNMDIEVENDETHTVDGHRRKEVKKNETVIVGGDRTEDVTGNETISIKKSRKETVDENETITISGNRTETVAKDEKISIDGKRVLTIAKDEAYTVSGKRTKTVEKDEIVVNSGNRTTTVDKNESLTVNGSKKLTVSEAAQMEVKKTITIKGDEEIVFKSGSASITLKKNGEIVIKGKDITIDGGGKVNVKASSALTMKGSTIKEN